jgi:general secretion pathway protein E
MHTGYRGRSAIFEILLMDDEIKKLILRTSDANQINELAIRHGMTTLLNDGSRKALEGVTTVEEVLRVTRVLKRGTDISLTLEE